MFPYIFNNTIPLGHDTLFHLSRIEGYGTAIAHLDFFPKIYYFKNLGFGYASPTFYSDILLFLPSLLYLFNVPVIIAYKFTVFSATLLAALSMFYLVKKIDKNAYSPYIASFIYTFCNYHITDVYVRSALGEMFAFIFLPVVLNGIYELLYKKSNKWYILSFGFFGLLLSHNISFLFGLIILLIYTLLNFKNKLFLKNVVIAGETCFILSAFYLLPLIEGMIVNDMYVNHYNNYSLSNSTFSLWQLFINRIVYGYGLKNSSAHMTINVGLVLSIFPLFYFFNKNKNKFILTALIIGYVSIWFSSDYFYTPMLSIFSIIQFAWRFNIVAMVMLTIPASIVLASLFNNKNKLIVLFIILVTEGIYHLLPVYSFDFKIKDYIKYEQLLSGEIIDPFFSAFYVRVELAGADYLPIGSPDFRDIKRCIYSDDEVITCDFTQTYNNFSFYLKNPAEVTLPVTYYKGYKVYFDNTEIEPYYNIQKLITFKAEKEGTYQLIYKGTFIQKYSLIFSLIEFIVLIYRYFFPNSLFKR